MKHFSFPALLFAFLTVVYAHSPSSSLAQSAALHEPQPIMVSSDSGQIFLKSTELPAESKRNELSEDKENRDDDQVESPKSSDTSVKSESRSVDDKKNLGDVEEEQGQGQEEETVTIADPIEPFNRAMFQFNDKLFFWVLKPVAQGYNKVAPEVARISVKNFFSNLGFPMRFISYLLQADFSGAGTELGRFTVNTIWGIGGLLDPSSGKELNLAKQDTDLGITLGVYGVGHGFYIVWPVVGPSSARDSVEIAGEYFLYPVSYIQPWYAWLGVRSFEVVNDTSLRIGDYESFKEAAIDPYVALRNAYIQYRQKKIKGRGSEPDRTMPTGVMLQK
jgi:phospholipid-binding lipoprotein MlaA